MKKQKLPRVSELYKRRRGAKVSAKNPKGGRPCFEPTIDQRKLVEALSGYGVPHDEIRLLVVDHRMGRPIAKNTLYRAFRQELDVGATKANAKVAGNLFRHATGDGPGSVTAAIFWTKVRMGWKETTVVERRDVKFEDLTDDELAQIIRSTDRELDRIVADQREEVDEE